MLLSALNAECSIRLLIYVNFFIFQEGIGLDAINDAFLLEGSIYRLLRRHCRRQPYYVHLLELFTEVEILHKFIAVLYVIYEMISKCSVITTLKSAFFVADIVPNRAGPSPRSDDSSPKQDRFTPFYHGQVRLRVLYIVYAWLTKNCNQGVHHFKYRLIISMECVSIHNVQFSFVF